MMDSVRKHIVKYPHARTSKLSYLAKRDETTAALQRYVASKMPWWKRLARAIAGRA